MKLPFPARQHLLSQPLAVREAARQVRIRGPGLPQTSHVGWGTA